MVLRMLDNLIMSAELTTQVATVETTESIDEEKRPSINTFGKYLLCVCVRDNLIWGRYIYT